MQSATLLRVFVNGTERRMKNSTMATITADKDGARQEGGATARCHPASSHTYVPWHQQLSRRVRQDDDEDDEDDDDDDDDDEDEQHFKGALQGGKPKGKGKAEVEHP